MVLAGLFLARRQTGRRLPDAAVSFDKVLQVLNGIPLQPRTDADEWNLPGIGEAP